MKNTNLHLFVIDNRINYNRVDSLFRTILSYKDMPYMACCNKVKNNQEVFACCFEKEKINILEKELNKLNVIIKSIDISKSTIQSTYCEELKWIINDNPLNKEIIEKFIIQNLNLDIIMDRICFEGMEGLSNIEDSYLKSL